MIVNIKGLNQLLNERHISSPYGGKLWEIYLRNLTNDYKVVLNIFKKILLLIK